MSKSLLNIMWIIFTGNLVNYGNILWEDFSPIRWQGDPKGRYDGTHIYKVLVPVLGRSSQICKPES